MFFAHLPAGYLLTRGLLALAPEAKSAVAQRWLLAAGMLASVLPDFDLLYYYLWSDQWVGHRAYVTHAPLFWLVLGAIGAAVAQLARRPRWHAFILVALANVLLHLALDTVAGPVRWLYPFSPEYFSLFPAPRQPGWWVWSYLAHWTMALEALITLGAIAVARRRSLRPEPDARMVCIGPYSLERAAGTPPAARDRRS